MIKFNHPAYILLVLAFAVAGCERANPPSPPSRIVIPIPSQSDFLKASKVSSSVSALAVVDYNLLCFAANIKGPAIRTLSEACNVERGITTGSVAPGNELIIDDVPLGENYTFEIFGLLRNSATETCPAVNVAAWNHPLTKIYLVGKTTGVKLIKQNEDVTVMLTMPDQAAHIAAQNLFPASCGGPTSGLKAKGRVLLGADVLTSTRFKLKYRISFKEESKILATGTTFKIKP